MTLTTRLRRMAAALGVTALMATVATVATAPSAGASGVGSRVLAAGTFDFYACRYVASNGVGVKYAVHNNGPFYITWVEATNSAGTGVWLSGIGPSTWQQNYWPQAVGDGWKYVYWTHRDYYSGATTKSYAGAFYLYKAGLPGC